MNTTMSTTSSSVLTMIRSYSTNELVVCDQLIIPEDIIYAVDEELDSPCSTPSTSEPSTPLNSNKNQSGQGMMIESAWKWLSKHAEELNSRD